MTTTHQGLALGHASAEIAAAHAGSEWVRIALEAFLSFAKEHQAFTTEQVRQAFPDLPLPPDKRAWGGITRLAKAEGIVEPMGWVRASSPTVHGMVVTLWKSKVLKVAADNEVFYGLPHESVSSSNAGGKCVTAGETAPNLKESNRP